MPRLFPASTLPNSLLKSNIAAPVAITEGMQ